jgi:hypothetical protein
MNITLLYIRIISKIDPNYKEPTSYLVGERRFIEGYKKFKPKEKHGLLVVNAGSSSKIDSAFDDIATDQISYVGTGWDCGTFKDVGGSLKCDLVVCFNTLSYLWTEDWLGPIVNCAKKYGKGVFGPTASYENFPHLRTPCIAFHPEVIKEYPLNIDDRVKACQFEHGPNNFSRWALSKGYPVIMVTKDGEYWQRDWRKPDNIFRRGDQSNCLVWDRHMLVYSQSTTEERRKLEKDADNVEHQPKPVYIGRTRIV